MSKDPLPTMTGSTNVTPPIDMTDANQVYQYTDDLVLIHDQLTTHFMRRQELNSSAEILCARVRQAFREYFDGNMLECWHMGKSSEEANEFIIAAHTRVIELFHALWGVLPSRNLDDYRVLEVSSYSLSRDFIDEALFGITSSSEVSVWRALGNQKENVDTHEGKGEYAHPIWVGPTSLLYQTFRGLVGSEDDEGNIRLDCLGPFEGGINALHRGGWVIGETAYINAEILDISGPGWSNVVGYTTSEIKDLYARRTNKDGE